MSETTKNEQLSSIESAPKFLRKTEDSKRFYKDLMQAAEDNNKVTKADKLAAALCAQYYAVYKAAEKALYNEDTGEMNIIIEQVGDKGQVRIIQHPAYQVYQTSFKQIMDCLRDFGLTPKSRKQVEEIENKTQSALEKFMQGGM